MGDRCAKNFPSPISGASMTAWRRRQQARPLGVCRAAVDRQQILYGLFFNGFSKCWKPNIRYFKTFCFLFKAVFAFLDLYGFSVDSCGIVGNIGEQLCFVEKNFVILTPHMISNCRFFRFYLATVSHVLL